MVRHYKRKKEISYSRENLLKAVEEVKSKRMSSYQAAEQFGVPRSTIFAHVTGTRGLKNCNPGRSTVFDRDTELRIVNCIHVMEKCGYPLTQKEVLSLISEYIRRNGIVTIFKNDIPGDDWLRGFRRRHKLSLKKPQSVEIARRKACNPFTVYEYFEILEKIVKELNLSSAPDRIYNLDETSFCQDPSKSKVVGNIGHRSTRTTSSPGRTNTTVLLAANANGDKIPPLIIFQGKYLWNEWFYQNENIKTAYAVSKKGWMETSIFEKYMKDVFVPAIGSERPVLLIYDGHSTHTDLSVIEFALSQRITILKLPPHSSDVLQPLDCSVMKPLKDRWDEELIKWQRMHVGLKLPKSEFAKILTGIWENLNPVIISNGFKKTGIYPVNRNVIGKEKFDPLTWQKWENHLLSLPKCDDTANSADAKESDDFEITTLNNVTSPVFTRATIQECPTLKDLTLRIINLSIYRHQNDDYDNSSRKEEHSADADNQLTMNDKGKKLENSVLNYEKTTSSKKKMADKENYVEDIAKINEKLNKTSKTYDQKQKEDHGMNDRLGGLTKINNPKSFRLPLKTEQNINNSGNSLLKIISDKVIKPAHCKKEEYYNAVGTTLEELVLSTIARNDVPRKPKKRIGAEILTYPDVVSRMKKAKEEQEIIKISKEKKKQEQQKKKANEKKGTKTKNFKKKPKLTKVKKNKTRVSDSESTGSYTSLDSSESEEVGSFFDNILKEDSCELIKKAARNEDQEISEINKEKKQNEQDEKIYKEIEKIIKTQEKEQKQAKVKKNKKWVFDNESYGKELSLDSDDLPNTSKNQFLSRPGKESKIPEKGTYPDVVSRMKKAKEEQVIIKINKGKKKQEQQKQKTNEKKGTKTKNFKKKQKLTKAKKNKTRVSDSESTGSYTSLDSSESEEMGSFFDNISKEDSCELIKKAARNEDQEISEINKEKKQNEQDEKIYKEKDKIIKTQEKEQKQAKAKKNKKWVFDNESYGNELSLDSDDLPNTSKNQFLSRPGKKSKIPEKGTFVLAKFTSYKGKKTYKYVCLIEEITSDKMVVQGFKSIKHSKTQFRLVENDVSIIDFEDFIECLPAPEFDDKNMVYIFPRNIAIIEM